MSRFHNIDGVNVPFTAKEEAARDAEEAAWEAERPSREAQSTLSNLDATLPRAVEDIADVLIAKGLIIETDLPQIMQDRRAEKAAARAVVRTSP